MESNINVTNEDKLPIKYVLGIQEELESFPDAFDIMHVIIGKAVRQPKRQKETFTKHAFTAYYAKGKEDNIDKGLEQAVGLGLIEQTNFNEGKEAFRILINPFV